MHALVHEWIHGGMTKTIDGGDSGEMETILDLPYLQFSEEVAVHKYLNFFTGPQSGDQNVTDWYRFQNQFRIQLGQAQVCHT
jgi:hypothetical protein